MAMSRSLGGMALTTRSPISTVPPSGRSRPAITFSRVDLPQPDGPSSTANSPFSTVRSIPLRTSTGPNRLCTPRTLSAAIDPPSCPLLYCAGGQAAQEISSAEEVDQQGRQCREQHGGALDPVFH